MYKVLNIETLLKIAPDLADRLDILTDFIFETRSEVSILEHALNTNDFPETVRLAHSIKGACAMIGADELAAVCGTIERFSRQRVPQAASSVRAAFDSLTNCLKTYLDEWARLCA